jgi:TRAP-type C4-dicarboxylate transport system substrate-binding protein
VIHTKDKPVKAVADMKGLKMRAPTRLITNGMKALGATPVGMPLPQFPEALSKGVVDGGVIPWEVVPAVKVQELTKYHSEFDPKLPALYTTTFILAMNKAKYDSLPPDLKKVIDANSGLETSAWLGRVQEGNDVPGRKSAEGAKNTITRLGPAEYEAFRKATDQVDDDWVKEMNGKGFNGKALLDNARALIQKNTK